MPVVMTKQRFLREHVPQDLACRKEMLPEIVRKVMRYPWRLIKYAEQEKKLRELYASVSPVSADRYLASLADYCRKPDPFMMIIFRGEEPGLVFWDGSYFSPEERPYAHYREYARQRAQEGTLRGRPFIYRLAPSSPKWHMPIAQAVAADLVDMGAICAGEEF